MKEAKKKPAPKQYEDVQNMRAVEKTVLYKDIFQNQNYDTNVGRYPGATLYAAITEHRWNDAARLLPCIFLHSDFHHIDFIWLASNILKTNDSKLSEIRCDLMDDLLSYGARPFEVALEKIASELPYLSVEQFDSFFQKIDEIASIRKSVFKGQDHITIRMQAYICAYKALGSYCIWKYQLCTKESDLSYTQDSSNEFGVEINGEEEDADLIGNMSHPKNSQGKYFELKEFVFSNFRKAIQHLNEPCEWIMGPFLEALSKVHGSQAAIDELTTYLSQYPSHLPARYLAYNFFKHEIPQSEDSQIEELEKIAEISPDDHLVFTLVKMLINRVDDWPFDTSDLHRWSDTQGKSVLKILPGVKNCRSLFKSELQRDTILNCVKIMMNMVEYQEWRWKEQPWIHLCHLLRRIYLTCKECGFCKHCRTAGSELINLRKEKTILWERYIWCEPEYSTITPKQAEIMFYTTYAAHVLKFGDSYVQKMAYHLRKYGFTRIADDLKAVKAGTDRLLNNWSIGKEELKILSSSTKTVPKEEAIKSQHIRGLEKCGNTRKCNQNNEVMVSDSTECWEKQSSHDEAANRGEDVMEEDGYGKLTSPTTSSAKVEAIMSVSKSTQKALARKLAMHSETESQPSMDEAVTSPLEDQDITFSIADMVTSTQITDGIVVLPSTQATEINVLPSTQATDKIDVLPRTQATNEIDLLPGTQVTNEVNVLPSMQVTSEIRFTNTHVSDMCEPLTGVELREVDPQSDSDLFSDDDTIPCGQQPSAITENDDLIDDTSNCSWFLDSPINNNLEVIPCYPNASDEKEQIMNKTPPLSSVTSTLSHTFVQNATVTPIIEHSQDTFENGQGFFPSPSQTLDLSLSLLCDGEEQSKKSTNTSDVRGDSQHEVFHQSSLNIACELVERQEIKVPSQDLNSCVSPKLILKDSHCNSDNSSVINVEYLHNESDIKKLEEVTKSSGKEMSDFGRKDEALTNRKRRISGGSSVYSKSSSCSVYSSSGMSSDMHEYNLKPLTYITLSQVCEEKEHEISDSTSTRIQKKYGLLSNCDSFRKKDENSPSTSGNKKIPIQIWESASNPEIVTTKKTIPHSETKVKSSPEIVSTITRKTKPISETDVKGVPGVFTTKQTKTNSETEVKSNTEIYATITKKTKPNSETQVNTITSKAKSNSETQVNTITSRAKPNSKTEEISNPVIVTTFTKKAKPTSETEGKSNPGIVTTITRKTKPISETDVKGVPDVFTTKQTKTNSETEVKSNTEIYATITKRTKPNSETQVNTITSKAKSNSETQVNTITSRAKANSKTEVISNPVIVTTFTKKAKQTSEFEGKSNPDIVTAINKKTKPNSETEGKSNTGIVTTITKKTKPNSKTEVKSNPKIVSVITNKTKSNSETEVNSYSETVTTITKTTKPSSKTEVESNPDIVIITTKENKSNSETEVKSAGTSNIMKINTKSIVEMKILNKNCREKRKICKCDGISETKTSQKSKLKLKKKTKDVSKKIKVRNILSHRSEVILVDSELDEQPPLKNFGKAVFDKHKKKKEKKIRKVKDTESHTSDASVVDSNLGEQPQNNLVIADFGKCLKKKEKKRKVRDIQSCTSEERLVDSILGGQPPQKNPRITDFAKYKMKKEKKIREVRDITSNTGEASFMDSKLGEQQRKKYLGITDTDKCLKKENKIKEVTDIQSHTSGESLVDSKLGEQPPHKNLGIIYCDKSKKKKEKERKVRYIASHSSKASSVDSKLSEQPSEKYLGITDTDKRLKKENKIKVVRDIQSHTSGESLVDFKLGELPPQKSLGIIDFDKSKKKKEKKRKEVRYIASHTSKASSMDSKLSEQPFEKYLGITDTDKYLKKEKKIKEVRDIQSHTSGESLVDSKLGEQPPQKNLEIIDCDKSKKKKEKKRKEARYIASHTSKASSMDSKLSEQPSEKCLGITDTDKRLKKENKIKVRDIQSHTSGKSLVDSKLGEQPPQKNLGIIDCDKSKKKKDKKRKEVRYIASHTSKAISVDSKLSEQPSEKYLGITDFDKCVKKKKKKREVGEIASHTSEASLAYSKLGEQRRKEYLGITDCVKKKDKKREARDNVSHTSDTSFLESELVEQPSKKYQRITDYDKCENRKKKRRGEARGIASRTNIESVVDSELDEQPHNENLGLTDIAKYVKKKAKKIRELRYNASHTSETLVDSKFDDQPPERNLGIAEFDICLNKEKKMHEVKDISSHTSRENLVDSKLGEQPPQKDLEIIDFDMYLKEKEKSISENMKRKNSANKKTKLREIVLCTSDTTLIDSKLGRKQPQQYLEITEIGKCTKKKVKRKHIENTIENIIGMTVDKSYVMQADLKIPENIKKTKERETPPSKGVKNEVIYKKQMNMESSQSEDKSKNTTIKTDKKRKSISKDIPIKSDVQVPQDLRSEEYENVSTVKTKKKKRKIEHICDDDIEYVKCIIKKTKKVKGKFM